MKYVLAFDPGVSSGVALASYSDDKPFDLVEAWQFGNGVQGILDWLNDHRIFLSGQDNLTAVCEKFVPIPGRGFSQSLDSTIPLVGEGVLIGQGLMSPYNPQSDRWQRPHVMYQHGGKNLSERKKKSRAFLKENGMYKMPRELGTKDSDDAMSATLHALYFITHTLKHKPTFDKYYAK